MKTITAALVSLLFTSCMHLGMMGLGGGHESVSDAVLEKEVVHGDVKAMATFPSLEVGREMQLTLRLSNTRQQQALRGAKVYFHVQYLHTGGEHTMHQSHMMQHDTASVHNRNAQDHDVNIDREVPETSEPGVYAISFSPSQEGKHELMFHITALSDRTLHPEIIIQATRTVSGKHSSHGGGMHGLGSVSDYAIIGAALMGAMMLVVWVTGGRMF